MKVIKFVLFIIFLTASNFSCYHTSNYIISNVYICDNGDFLYLPSDNVDDVNDVPFQQITFRVDIARYFLSSDNSKCNIIDMNTQKEVPAIEIFIDLKFGHELI